MNNTIPKLSDLSDEQRRVLCAEALGWKQRPDKFYIDRRHWTHTTHGKCATPDLPNPDEDANDALKLVENLRSLDLRWRSDNIREAAGYISVFYSFECRHEARENTLPRAIVSAFLLATGKATNE